MATARDFEFDRIEAFVKKHGATVLALQFPAHLLGAAPAVATPRTAVMMRILVVTRFLQKAQHRANRLSAKTHPLQ